MKILCLCQKGNSRSAALTWYLRKYMGHETLAAGMRTTSEETKKVLFNWAEMIILVVKEYKGEIPRKCWNKLKVWDVGRDIYFRGFDERLINKFKNYIKLEDFKKENEKI